MVKYHSNFLTLKRINSSYHSVHRLSQQFHSYLGKKTKHCFLSCNTPRSSLSLLSQLHQRHPLLYREINVLSEPLETCLLFPESYDNRERNQEKKKTKNSGHKPGEVPLKAEMPLGTSANINPSFSKVGSAPPVTTKRSSTPFQQCSLSQILMRSCLRSSHSYKKWCQSWNQSHLP